MLRPGSVRRRPMRQQPARPPVAGGRRVHGDFSHFRMHAHACAVVRPEALAAVRLSSVEAVNCRFGAGSYDNELGGGHVMLSPASAHGSEGVRCASPAALPTGWSAVELESYGSALMTSGQFYVHPVLLVSEVVPSSGPVAGGTRVSVLGASTLRESSTLRCRFESSGATAPARFVARGQIECASPPSSSSGARHVEVSLNGQQWSNSGVAFTYRPAAAVSSVWPVRGAMEGGTPVTVQGSGFSQAAEALGALRCRFNETSVPAAYVSESQIVCNTTASSPGLAVVEVTTNGQDYTMSGVRFEALAVLMNGITPWLGPYAPGGAPRVHYDHIRLAGCGG